MMVLHPSNFNTNNTRVHALHTVIYIIRHSRSVWPGNVRCVRHQRRVRRLFLVARLLARLPATPPAAGLALPHAQLVARRALGGTSRGRCWTTQLFPPGVAHDRTCAASHLRLVPLPSPRPAAASCPVEEEKARRGAKKAILAVAASMLTAAFHMLRDGTEYNDLGSEHFDRQDKSKTIRRLLKRLQDLGCNVPQTVHMA